MHKINMIPFVNKWHICEFSANRLFVDEICLVIYRKYGVKVGREKTPFCQ